MSGSPAIKVALRDLPQSEKVFAEVRHAVARLAAEFPAVTACQIELRPCGGVCEAHLEVTLPERQIILNQVHGSAGAALDEALNALKDRIPSFVARAA